MLAAQFIREANRSLHKKVQSISRAALAMLEAHSWPGNVREFRNIIFRAVLSAEKSVELEHIQLEPSTVAHSTAPISASPGNSSPLTGQTLKEAVAPLEKEMIQKALKETGGNKVRTARLLGIDRKALYYKIQKHGL